MSIDYKDYLETLMNVRELLGNQNRWTRNTMARNESGDEVRSPNGDDAVSWCLTGAFHAFGKSEHLSLLDQSVRLITNYDNSVRLNDDTDHKTVIWFLDREIKTIEKQA